MVFELLVEKGGDVSLTDANGDNILHIACCGGNIEMVKYVLSHTKLDISSRGRYGRTPLMTAAYSGHDRVFELLVERGGDVSVIDANGDNILHTACYGGHIEMVKYVLLHTKLDINSRGRYRRTPLMTAAYSGHDRVFELLVERGGNVSVIDADGDNILHTACYGGHIEMVKYVLLHTKLDINSRGRYGRTPLMLAADKGPERVFELLVERGGDVSLVDANGDNVLHIACSGGHIEMVKYVLSHTKLNINSRGRYGRTPLMKAAYFGHNRVFELLVLRGGNVSVIDADGDNILHTACYGGHIEMVKYVLLHTKLDINSRGRYGRTPLMKAAYSGHNRVFELLVMRGGNVSVIDADGDNILHTACYGGHIEMVKYVLLHTKLDINSRGQSGRTPVMLAARKGQERVFQLLVDRGANVSLKDDFGDDITHMACSGGHLDMVKYVLSQGTRHVNRKRTQVDNCE
ncbi:ankyrin repeat domain-containing protein 50-like [Haliotis asinina]|uniref:ankyrin repeat domain-containing protein 50-like n=1 Tax=Haliotis asinina TaxID=109174 RepID=UPI0035325047